LAAALFRDPLDVLKPQLEPESRLCPPSLNVLPNAVHWLAPQQPVLAAIIVFLSVAVEPFDIEIALPELTAPFPVKVLLTAVKEVVEKMAPPCEAPPPLLENVLLTMVAPPSIRSAPPNPLSDEFPVKVLFSTVKGPLL